MPNWNDARINKTTKPLLDLAYNALFCHEYGYHAPSRQQVMKALFDAGIADPCYCMEEWRKNEGVHTDIELAEMEEE